jgi:hypothetical protein
MVWNWANDRLAQGPPIKILEKIFSQKFPEPIASLRIFD